MDNEPLGILAAEEIAALLVAEGYQARAIFRPGTWGHRVIVTGTHGKSGRFRYVITSADQLPKALADLARGESGGSNTLEEGI